MKDLTDEEFQQVMDVFALPGWAIIINDIEETYQNMNSLLDIQSAEQFWEAKGGLQKLAWFKNLQAWYEFQVNEDDAI